RGGEWICPVWAVQRWRIAEPCMCVSLLRMQMIARGRAHARRPRLETLHCTSAWASFLVPPAAAPGATIAGTDDIKDRGHPMTTRERPSVLELQRQLNAGETTSEELIEQALARIADPEGEGSRAFTAVWADQARAAARASDILRAAGLARSELEGLPISVKDLFDVAGKVTRAGSAVRRDAPPAERHATAVERLV